MTPSAEDHQEADRVRLFLQLAVLAQRNVDLEDPADYWYRLGTRNAYAAAAAHLVRSTEPDAALVMADRVTSALGDNVHDVGELERIVREPLHKEDPAVTLEWIGAPAFHRAHSDKGLDLDLGMRWGERQSVRISLRRKPGDTVGLLYAYDWIWDECAVLADSISIAAAQHAFNRALALDDHMEPASFATLIPSAIEVTKERAHSGFSLGIAQ